METVMLLSIMATTLALSLYFMWKAFKGLPKQPLNTLPQRATSHDSEAIAASSQLETLSPKPARQA